MANGCVAFELDLIEAAMDQLPRVFEVTKGAPLTVSNTQELPKAPGVYLLIHDDEIGYVGKTDNALRARLTRHVRKFEQRKNVKPEDVTYKAAQTRVLAAMDIEKKLIALYKAKWTQSSFGSNDPGRDRETTNKPADGFDAQFPVDIDISMQILDPGLTTVHEALVALKDGLPYCLRYEVAPPPPRTRPNSSDYKKNPHPDMRLSQVTIPAGPLTVRDAMKLIVAALPAGWQATYFVSHIILYKESRTYAHGTPI